MEKEIASVYILYNGQPIETDKFDYTKTKKYPGVYEVIRVIDGVPLFTERHFIRFRSSAKLLGFQLNVSDKILLDQMSKLINVTNNKNGNIKIIINNLDKPEPDTYVYFMKHKYPTKDEILHGVPVTLFHGERNNPNAKTTDLAIREKINEKIKTLGAYEALLVNKNNEITEGSRSNIFAVKGTTVYTPPTKSVLPGVTRGYIMDICKELKREVVESPISLNMLHNLDGLFLTGTSPQVLPISSVDEVPFESASNPVIREIREAYESLVAKYVSERKFK